MTIRLRDVPGIEAALERARKEIEDRFRGDAVGATARSAPDLAKERARVVYANIEIERIRRRALGMKCPQDGHSCFDLDCQTGGCQG